MINACRKLAMHDNRIPDKCDIRSCCGSDSFWCGSASEKSDPSLLNNFCDFISPVRFPLVNISFFKKCFYKKNLIDWLIDRSFSWRRSWSRTGTGRTSPRLLSSGPLLSAGTVLGLYLPDIRPFLVSGRISGSSIQKIVDICEQWQPFLFNLKNKENLKKKQKLKKKEN